MLALEKLLGIFKIHKLVAFVISADSGDLHSRFIDLTTSIERTAYRTAPEYTQRVFDNALSEFSKVEIHRAGVTLLSSKDRTSDDQLKDALTRLVDGLRYVRDRYNMPFSDRVLQDFRECTALFMVSVMATRLIDRFPLRYYSCT